MEKHCVTAPKAPPPVGPYSHAVIAGNFVFVSGMGPFTQEGGVLDAPFEAQVRLTLDNVKAALDAAGTDLAHVVKTTIYLADMNDFAALNRVYQEYFTEAFPARATTQAARLPKDTRVEIEAVALLP